MIIALGAGDGHLEVRLVQNIISLCASPDIELLLFDISQPLLTAAYQHAVDTFSEKAGVHTLLAHGNFHDLGRYPQVSYMPAKGRRKRIYLDYAGHEFAFQLGSHTLIPGSYQLDAIATVRNRSQAERRFSMFRFKRYDEALLAESLARFGWDKVISLPIGESDRAPVAMLLVKR